MLEREREMLERERERERERDARERDARERDSVRERQTDRERECKVIMPRVFVQPLTILEKIVSPNHHSIVTD